MCRKITALHAARVLFPEDLPHIGNQKNLAAADLNFVNHRIKELWKLIPDGKAKAKAIEAQYRAKDKALCYERFEHHVSELAKEVSALPPNPTPLVNRISTLNVVKGMWLCLLALAITTIVMAVGGFVFVPFALLAIAVFCIAMMISVTYCVNAPLENEEAARRVQGYLGLSLAEAQQELSVIG